MDTVAKEQAENMVKRKDKTNSGEYDDDDEGDILPFQGHVVRGKDIQAL